MSENWQQSEICIVINDKSQDSTAKHLSYDGLLHYKFVNHCAGERIILQVDTQGINIQLPRAEREARDTTTGNSNSNSNSNS